MVSQTFLQEPYNNTHYFEQRSQTFQQIQLFFFFNIKHMLYLTTGIKFFKTIFTDIQITLFTLVFFLDCLPFLSALYPHAVHVFRFG